ncbi:head GIN domain-containing protein [Chloroflexota bacterium]
MKNTITLVAITAVLIATALFSGCTEAGLGERNAEKEEVITEERDFADFTYLDVSAAFNVEITRSDSFSVIISADKSLFDLIEVSRVGDTLKIFLNPRHIFTDFTLGTKTLKAEITMPALYGLEISGASSGTISGFKSTKDFSLVVSGASSLETIDTAVGDAEVEVSGASRLSGNMTAEDADFEVSGASSIVLSGSADDLALVVSGASRVDLANFPVDDADIGLSGASEATLNVIGRLDTDLSGASRLYFYGNPTMGETSISGASTIKHK